MDKNEKIEVEKTEPARPTRRPATRNMLKMDGEKRKAEEEISTGEPSKMAKSNEGKKLARKVVKDPPAEVSKISNLQTETNQF